jgi:hypothetical protein
MPFNQQTECIKATSHSSWNQYLKATVAAILAAGAGAAVAGIAGMPWCAPFAATILPAVWLIAYCEWWLFDRLICLDGDKTIVAMLVSTEPPGNKSFPDSLDTDFSINLLLPPNPPGVDQATAELSVPFGFLLKGQDATNNIGLPCPGETATDQGTGVKSAILHAEFEGNGIADALIGAQVGLVLAVASLLACLAIPLPWGVIVAAILAFLAFLAMLLGLLFGLGDEGDPADVDPSLGTLHTNDAANGGIGADLLAVMGTWVYDTAHEGWNEIHPIKQCQKVGTWGGDWPPDINDIIKHWETAIGEATSPTTGTEQKNPEHHWGVHPDVDGCNPNGATPPPPLH